MTKTKDQRPKTAFPKAQDQRPKATEVAAIILAAGQSTRMGAFKALLPFGPKTVIETCINNLRSGGIGTVVVVVGTGPRAEELTQHLKNSNVIFAINPDPDSEMSSSIACGVRAVSNSSKAVIINPVDHAAVPGEIVAQLLNEWERGALLVKPSWNQRGGHPVLIDLSFRDQLLDLDPQGGLKTFFNQRQDQVKRVDVNSNLIARDMDTWDDYVALHQEVFGVPAPALPPGKRA
jgi:molybdenum cofactor cytidylyltransferase